MADVPTLAEILMRRPPVMPEEFDRPEALGRLTPHAEAFGAGAIDPMGLLSRLINKLVQSPSTDWYERWTKEKRDQSPVAAGAGSGLTMGLLTSGTAGPLLGAGSLAEALSVVPPIIGIGAAGGKAVSGLADLGILNSPPIRQRPQAAYPPGGAGPVDPKDL